MPYSLFSYFDYSVIIKWPFVRPVDEMMSEEQSFASHLAFFTSSIPCSDDWPAAYESKSLNWCQWRILNILWVILNWCSSLPDFLMSCLSVHYNSLSIWKLSLIWYNDIEVKILQFANRVSRALVKQTLQGPYCARSGRIKCYDLGVEILDCGLWGVISRFMTRKHGRGQISNFLEYLLNEQGYWGNASI